LIVVLGPYESKCALLTDLVTGYFVSFSVEIIAENRVFSAKSLRKEGDKPPVLYSFEEGIDAESFLVNADRHCIL
jgi:hypothetical protein